MKFKLMHDGRQRTFVVILDPGEEVIKTLKGFAQANSLYACQFTAIGAFREATVGFFDFLKKDYKKIAIPQPTEVLSLTGDITQYKNAPQVHAHVVLGKEDGTAHGGHLMKAEVYPTLEIVLTDSPFHLQRKMNDTLGLPMIEL
jgi:predicted DNA-binding protein with PD1-like motif